MLRNTQTYYFLNCLFEKYVNSHNKATRSHEGRHPFSHSTHLPTKSSKAGPIEVWRGAWVSLLASVENGRPQFSQICAGTDHKQKYQQDAGEVKNGAHPDFLAEKRIKEYNL